MSEATLLYLPADAALRFLPEGPYPSGPDQFSWVAIQHGAESRVGSIQVFDVSTSTNQSYPLPGRPGFAFRTDRGNFVVGCERTIAIYHPQDGSMTTLAEGIDADVSGTIINDGLTWDGNLLFGCKDLEFATKKAGLYFWRGSDRRLFKLRGDQICSNGKCIAAKGEGWVDLLDIDTPTKSVVRYRIDIEAGKIVSETKVVDLTSDPAFPDGMTMSLDGESVIISLYNPNPAAFGRTIQVRLKDQAVVAEWRTPASPQATCPQWFVDSQDSLWLIITTAVEHMPSERQAEAKNAGALFAVPFGKLADQTAYNSLTQPFVEP
jgi:sugar lactone lactonase YvrE